MRYLRFLVFSVIGVVAWVFSLTMAGYLLGEIPLVRQHFEKVIFLIILVSLIPVLSETIRHRRKQAAPRVAAATDESAL
jgi:membrane-associated protein